MNSTDTDAFLRDILSTVKTIAMVGASDKVSRPSHGVFGFLVAQGYRVIGVIPPLLDQNPCAQSRRPMEVMWAGCSISLFQASQQ